MPAQGQNMSNTGQSMSSESKGKSDPSPERASPRANAELDVDVEVAGEKRRVKLVSRDIGAGGMFLRTDEPAPLWKRVKLCIALPDGKNFEIGGEVVRSIPRDRAKQQTAGMAVAFDEVSRTRHKMLLQLVLDLCARRPDSPAAPATPSPTKDSASSPVAEKRPADQNDPEALLSEIDSLLDSMESEIRQKKKAGPPTPATAPRPAPAVATQPAQAARVDMKASPPAQKPAAPKPAQLPPRPGGEDLVALLRRELAAYQKALEDDNYYHILEVKKDASADDIQKAYQRLLERFKPSCPPEALPRELMRQLSEVLGRIRKAYAILSHPDRRKAYDFLLE